MIFKETISPHIHNWLRKIEVVFAPGPLTPLLEQVFADLVDHFRRQGHEIQAQPDNRTDIVITTAQFGQPMGWREALLFTSRRQLGIDHTPTIYTFIQVAPEKLQESLDYFEKVLAKEPPDPKDYEFPGLAPDAYRTLMEQGRRGGPLMALERLLQAQAKSIHIVLVIGETQLQYAYLFDLVGAHPRVEAGDPEFFYTDLTLRMVTTVSTTEVTQHQITNDPIPQAVWRRLSAPAAMLAAARQLGQRHFFTEMVRIADIIHVPAVGEAVASQYSEGCFATWEPALNALVATVTGSARPVDKNDITEDDLAVIVGVRPDGRGALVRQVEGKRNDPPSSEAVEMKDMDQPLPTITLGQAWGEAADAHTPVSRSKLHGHRGVAAYDARRVEFVPLDTPYYYYPVSCATEAQARGIKMAFARSEALRNPGDPREVVFTVLPGHGVVIVERWTAGKAPFQVIWEYIDAGYLQIENCVPQGWVEYMPRPGEAHWRVLKDEG